MDNNEYKEKLKMKIAMFNAVEDINKESNEYFLENNNRKGVNLMKRKIIATTCASLVLISGIVFATNFENIKTHFRGLGKGVDTAVGNGYIANPNAEKTDSNTIAINKKIKIDNINAKINIENFLMDDVNLSTQILFEFDEKIKELVNLDKVNAIELTDLIIKDEENRIIYGGNNEERFKKYCEENNLNYTFCEYNDNYMNCGVNCFNVSKDKENNSIKIMYNMYTDKFPKSKKLHFSFKTIQMLEISSEESMQNKIIVNGNWDIPVDVPKEMYNRTDEYYKVVNCDNPDFNVYTAKVTNTGFELGVIISNIEKPEFDSDKYNEFVILNDAYNKREISKEEYIESEAVKWYDELTYLLRPISLSVNKFIDKETIPSYVENKNNKKFESTLSSTRKTKNDFIGTNKFDFYDTFAMTKYDATEEIKVILYYYGKPVTIELKK